MVISGTVLYCLCSIDDFTVHNSIYNSGAFPVQDVRTFILESSCISKAGSSDEIQSLCQKARELHLGHNDISEWDTVW